MTKFCVDCAHYRALQKKDQVMMGDLIGKEIDAGVWHHCVAEYNLITGARSVNDCDRMRYAGRCGLDASLFEAKAA